MTNEFTVVGEHRDNELELLVLGADGGYYGYSPVNEAFHPVQPDEDWIINIEMLPEDAESPSTRERRRQAAP